MKSTAGSLYPAPRSRSQARAVSRRLRLAAAVLLALFSSSNAVTAEEVTKEEVERAIKRGTAYLVGQQAADGSIGGGVGQTSLSALALINSGMTMDDEPVARAIQFIRGAGSNRTYEVSLMIMALVAANDGNRDLPLIARLARTLETPYAQNPRWNGTWNYFAESGPGDNSNTQFAILALREAAQIGVHVDRGVWEQIRAHWVDTQNGDGGWGYYERFESYGSMTVAGIASLVIVDTLLRDDDLDANGEPRCCNEVPNEPLVRGVAWLERNFSATSNPGNPANFLYYIYGLERAGRLSGRRFFGDHDWYREGARFLVDAQVQRDGSWADRGARGDSVGTSFALLFLSKGLAPVLINKLKYRTANEQRARNGNRGANARARARRENWNLHPNDIRNLTENIGLRPKWPKLLTWQEVDVDKVIAGGGVQDLLQAPILYLSGLDNPEFADDQVQLIRNYANQGGFIFAVNNCNGAGFHKSVQDLVKRMYPEGPAELKRLTADHPVFRSEFLLDAESSELWGVDLGCRTVLIYSPDDHSCMWDRLTVYPIPDRPVSLVTQIEKSTRVGVNVVAYATGREPPKKLDRAPIDELAAGQDQIERGFLQIAKLRHPGDWNAAPNALRNLLLALNKAAGVVASTKQRDLTAVDQNVFKYPVLYMHGREPFEMTAQEREQLREYLKRGNVLFADACCGAPRFDKSFREFIAQLYPDRKLERIPATHEIFNTDIGYDIRKVKRRNADLGNNDAVIEGGAVEAEPFLEAIEVGGRYAVIYSKYDISCALERQAAVACPGYSHEDAVRIAVNIIRYAMLQAISYKSEVQPIR